MNALNVLCAQLTRDLFAIAKFLSCSFSAGDSDLCVFLSESRWRKWFSFFRANFSKLLLLIVSYARSLLKQYVTLTHIILLVCVVPGVSNLGLRIACSEATTTHNSNVPFAYYISNRSSLYFSTVIVVKLCNSNMQCSLGFLARGQLPPSPPYGYATAA